MSTRARPSQNYPKRYSGIPASSGDGFSPATTTRRLETTEHRLGKTACLRRRRSVVSGKWSVSGDDGFSPAPTVRRPETTACLRRRRFFSRDDGPSSLDTDRRLATTEKFLRTTEKFPATTDHRRRSRRVPLEDDHRLRSAPGNPPPPPPVSSIGSPAA